jgi:hypothetical protein
MSYPREHMKRALWHAKAVVGALRKAANAIDVDIDATPFDDELPDNPQSRLLQLTKSYNDRSIR